jgi:murein L,D-transpeptidase YcbB/YkuD
MRRRFVLFLVFSVFLVTDLSAQVSATDAGEQLRRRVETVGDTGDIVVGGERIHAEIEALRFYENQGYRLVWTENGQLSPDIDALIEEIRQSAREGMRPGEYHLARIEQLVEQIRRHGEEESTPGLLVDLDLLCTDAFLLQAAHRLSGRVDPESLDREWIANRRSQDLVALLGTALAEQTVSDALDGLLPPQPEYRQLREHLDRYRQMASAGGWEVVPDGPTLKQGDQGSRVRTLRQRLDQEGYGVVGTDTTDEIFDGTLDSGVRNFQKRHGLDVDGVVGAATLRALNVPASARARRIALNMERWRWLPQELGQRHVLVNIAGFWLEVVEDQTIVLDMRVIVGRSYRRTPVFSDQISYLVFNPYWNVPSSIATRDILPQLKQNPSYLAGQNMKLFSGWGADARELDPQTIDWSRVTATSFPYRIRQEPGPNNALGMVKFMFPNRFSVYLHDTPARQLFAQSMRTFSSGCIRVENPVALAVYLLRDQPQWTPEKIKSLSSRTQEQTVRLTRPIPVHLLYWTAWVNEEGYIEFRNDIYGRDLILDNALQEDPPAPTMP